jgi:DNA-binding IclR family transcriptional regulator
MNEASARPAGTQSIHRAAAVLRALALRSQAGARMADIALETGLERPTTHRILQGLIAEGMAYQHPGSRRYMLGPFLYELGLSAEPRFHLKDLARQALQVLAEKTGDTVFLAVRAGPDALCIDRKEGGFPIKVFPIDVGTRIPLGVGVGGLAMLSALPEEEARSVIEYNTPRLANFGELMAPELSALVAATRKRGYAINQNRAPGVAAVGVALRNPDGGLAGSISIAAIESRLSAQRIDEVARLIRTEARKIEKTLVQPPTPA